MSLAIEGYGAIVGRDNGSGNYRGIAEVVKISGPNMEGKAIDVTHLLSPEAFREFIPGLVDGGEVTLELNYIGSVHGFLFALWRLVDPWRIAFADGSFFDFDAFITKLGDEVPLDDKLSTSVTLKITGYPEFTEGTSGTSADTGTDPTVPSIFPELFADGIL